MWAALRLCMYLLCYVHWFESILFCLSGNTWFMPNTYGIETALAKPDSLSAYFLDYGQFLVECPKRYMGYICQTCTHFTYAYMYVYTSLYNIETTQRNLFWRVCLRLLDRWSRIAYLGFFTSLTQHSIKLFKQFKCILKILYLSYILINKM